MFSVVTFPGNRQRSGPPRDASASVLQSGIIAAWCIALVVFGMQEPASAFTPESPEVQQMIAAGLDYLSRTEEERLGGKCLIAMAFVKQGKSNHPKVKEAVDSVLAYTKEPAATLSAVEKTYSLTLAPIFLMELDPELYSSEIATLLEQIWRRQNAVGAWSYLNDDEGDTSMTQYAVLACWSANATGFNVPSNVVRDVCGWLIRTQDIEGGFGYRPKDPGSNKGRVKQPQVRESVTAAGLGSLYICWKLFGLASDAETDTGLPPAFEPVVSDRRLSGRGLATAMRRAARDGNQWYAKNFTVEPRRYPYYHLYALERYQSFRELVEKTSVKEPAWYNAGVRFLQNEQSGSGQWGASGAIGDPVATAFAILFLQRSTRKSIRKQKLGQGLLVGGRGLPKDMRQVRVVDVRVVNPVEKKTLSAIAQMLQDPENEDLQRFLDDPDSLQIQGGTMAAAELQVLRAAADNAEPKTRALALRALARRQLWDDIPRMIQALGSNDARVVIAARDALRRISRRLDGFQLPDRSTPQQRAAAIERWEAWYRQARPAGKPGN